MSTNHKAKARKMMAAFMTLGLIVSFQNCAKQSFAHTEEYLSAEMEKRTTTLYVKEGATLPVSIALNEAVTEMTFLGWSLQGAESDFNVVSGQARLLQGDQKVSLELATKARAGKQGDRTYMLNLAEASPAAAMPLIRIVVVDADSAGVDLDQNDIPLPKISYSVPACLRGTLCQITLRLDKPSKGTLEFNWVTDDEAWKASPAPGKAPYGKPNVQYIPVSDGFVQFLPGETVKTIGVQNINPNNAAIRIRVLPYLCQFEKTVIDCEKDLGL